MIRIGIICPSEIARRRFLPALQNNASVSFVAIASANKNEWEGATDENIHLERKKALEIAQEYDAHVYKSYREIIDSECVDALYLPLPPALHYYWGREALLAKKHIILEKPATTSMVDTNDLISLAEKFNLAIHENYMFVFHKQLTEIDTIVESGEVGEIRLYRLSFGFPKRSDTDFRYNKKMGGGALLDCGGYTIKYARMLLGESSRIVYANSNYLDGYEVDMYGSATLINNAGTTVQISFGMDNSYRCELEVWGSKGSLHTNRVFTAPDGFIPEVCLNSNNKNEIRKLKADDAFDKSIKKFQECVGNIEIREENHKEIVLQARFIDEFKIKSMKERNEK